MKKIIFCLITFISFNTYSNILINNIGYIIGIPTILYGISLKLKTKKNFGLESQKKLNEEMQKSLSITYSSIIETPVEYITENGVKKYYTSAKIMCEEVRKLCVKIDRRLTRFKNEEKKLKQKGCKQISAGIILCVLNLIYSISS